MNDYIAEITLDLNCERSCQTIMLTQFDKGKKIHLTVTANRSLADEAQITLNNIVLADNNAQAHYAPSASAPVNNITGINDLTAASHRVWTDGNVLHIVAQQPMSAQIVAINGTMQQVALDAGDNAYELTPGIYVVHIDGRGHKVVVK